MGEIIVARIKTNLVAVLGTPLNRPPDEMEDQPVFADSFRF